MPLPDGKEEVRLRDIDIRFLFLDVLDEGPVLDGGGAFHLSTFRRLVHGKFLEASASDA